MMIEKAKVLVEIQTHLALHGGYSCTQARQYVLADSITSFTYVVVGSDGVPMPSAEDKKTCKITIYRNDAYPEVCDIYGDRHSSQVVSTAFKRTYFSSEKYEYILVELVSDGSLHLFEKAK